ncbi:MAG TPA: hypothetical protein PK228_07630 [Saprospiraceae bacterium]|nr:hypothetical protein [Saprospiraceae bacterium]
MLEINQSMATRNQPAPPQLDPGLFWDVDATTIDWEKNARWVIARVLSYGNLPDFRELVRYYGLERIKQEMLQVRYLDKKTLSFVAALFQIPKEQFRCYTLRQSTPQLSPF